MKRLSKLLCTLLAIFMLVCALPAVGHAEELPAESPFESPVESPTVSPVESPTASPVESPTESPVESTTESPAPITPVSPAQSDWSVSKSKMATNLDKNFESNVTLSLPSAEEQLITDVVFVLDKSTSAAVEDQILDLLNALKSQVANTSAKVKVGVVIFNKEANDTLGGLVELNDANLSEIESAIKTNLSSGTNTHAGLLAGKNLLDGDTAVDASRKHLIFVSDGITYIFNESPTAVAWTFKGDTTLTFAGPDNWKSKYGSDDPPQDYSLYLGEIKAQVEADGAAYDYPYGGTIVSATPVEEMQRHANSIDKALYMTYSVYQEAVEAGYHCYALTGDTSSGSRYPWGPSFMEFLGGNQEVSFGAIQNDIYYLLAAGSTVTDVIGKTDDYDFDFIQDASRLKLTVCGSAYTAAQTSETLNENETARYAFTHEGVTAENGASAPFILHYYAKGQDGSSDECFVWDINVAVSNFAPVQLTYGVKLTNPKSAAGTYGQYDAYGENGFDGLYTNNSAVLSPVDSNGSSGSDERFNKPTVCYTVNGSGGYTPTEPTYYPDYTETPTPTPTAAYIADGDHSPKTGENAHPGLIVLLTCAAGVLLFGLRRRDTSR